MTISNNTITNGGITFTGRNSVVSDNVINRGGSGTGIYFTVQGTVSNNKISNCDVGIYLYAEGSITVEGNTVNQSKIGIKANPVYVAPEIKFNNIEASEYLIYLEGSRRNARVINAKYNWWGTTDARMIAQKIYDFYDDSSKSLVDFSPLLSSPSISVTVYDVIKVIPTGFSGAVSSPTVTLNLDVTPTPKEMMISEDHTFAGASWEPYSPTKEWTLSNPGNYIYAKFRGSPESAIAFTRLPFFHAPITEALTGKPVLIRVVAPSGRGVAGVSAFYRVHGSGSYTEIPLVKRGGEYHGFIPKNAMTQAGVDYYILAKDGGGRTLATYPFENPESNPIFISPKSSIEKTLHSDHRNVIDFAGMMEIDIPLGALRKQRTLELFIPPSLPAPPPEGLAVPPGMIYDLRFSDGYDSFEKPIKMTFLYKEDDVTGTGKDEGTLRAFVWDEKSGKWRYAGGELDKDTNKLSLQIKRTAKIALFAGCGETQVPIKKGLNLLTVPFREGAYSARWLLERISGCKIVTPWDAERQRYGDSTLAVGDGGIIGSDFELKPGYSYFVQADEDMTVPFGGAPLSSPPPVKLRRGLNFVSIPYKPETYAPDPESLIRNIPNSRVVTPWDADLQKWGDSAIKEGGRIIPPSKPFSVKSYAGFVVQVESDVPSWTPGSPAPPLPVDRSDKGPIVLPPPISTRIGFVRLTDISATSAAISWLTDLPCRGAVEYGPTPDLGLAALEDGEGRLHRIELTGLSPETTCYYRISGDGRLYTFRTTRLTAGVPYIIYGEVYDEDGFTPAEGAMVYVRVRRGHRESLTLAALVDEDGLWQVNLGNLKDRFSGGVFRYMSGDQIQIEVQGADGEGGARYPERVLEVKGPEYMGRVSLVGGLVLEGSDGGTMPQRSELLQNFPNPFNPETWIPFQLSEPADVEIKIYDGVGRLVRVLDLGHLDAGYYLDKDKAAHWDGRNEKGERVASGVYWYCIQAGRFRATRRLLLLK